jgi:pyruvate decarboxylase
LPITDPAIVADLLLEQIDSVIRELVITSGLPTFVTPLAQGFINESLPNFGGLYAGSGSQPGVREYVERSDFVLHIGPLDTDVTTYLGSAQISPAAAVKLFDDHVHVGNQSYTSVYLHHFVPELVAGAVLSRASIQPFVAPASSNSPTLRPNNGPITHAWLWPYISKWLPPGDIVSTDTGTASFGIFDTHQKVC